MSGRSRNFRRRGADDDDDDDGATASSTTKLQSKSAIATNAASAKPKKPLSQVPKSLLSFADDEETDAPPISLPSAKRSSASRFPKPLSSSSHKLISSKDRLASSSSSSTLPSNVQPQAGTYTKEALLELQKNTKTLASSRTRPPQPPSEPVIVLKGLVKPSNQVDLDVRTTERIHEAVERDVDADENEVNLEKDQSLFSRETEKDEAVAGFGKLGLGKGRDLSTLDKETINAIRARRERLRQAGAAAPDYIALDAGSNHGEAEGLSDEEPEFRGRIGFFGAKIESGKKGLGVFEDVDGKTLSGGFRKDVEVGGGNEDDEDEEDKIWEEEQFRKALGKRMDDGASRVVSSGNGPVVQSVQQQKFVIPSMASTYPSVPIATVTSAAPNIGGTSFSSLDMMPISQQAEVARNALLENVKRLKESHGRTIASLNRTDENLSASLSNVTTLESSLSAAGEKYIFMQKIRDFVSVMCDFLQHKAPFIEELEDQMLNLYKERAAAILERRAADNDDEMKELELAVNAAVTVLSKGGSNSAMMKAASSAAQAAVAATKELRDVPVELDDYGRDMNLQKRMDLTRRSEARKQRRARSESKRISLVEKDGSYQHIEGESSTDESDSESAAFQSNRDQLLQIADEIFSDAAEEYSRLPVVVEKFEKWKKKYSSSYNDAYMSLSIPAIFSPYIRLELLKWDPLNEESDFIDMQWHSLLFNYGVPEDDKNEINPDDADYNIIPELVEKLAIPVLHHQLEFCWDMLSTSETKHAVAATDLIFRYVPASSTAVSKLVAVLCDRLAHAVACMEVPTWNVFILESVPNAARVAAYRFGMSVRLMRNICLWSETLAVPILEKLALDGLLCGKVLPHLYSIQSNIYDAVTRSERIISSLSNVWAGTNVKRSPKLQPMVDYLHRLGDMLEEQRVSGGIERSAGLARRLKKMLVELNEYDYARAISKTFNLKEAL